MNLRSTKKPKCESTNCPNEAEYESGPADNARPWQAHCYRSCSRHLSEAIRDDDVIYALGSGAHVAFLNSLAKPGPVVAPRVAQEDWRSRAEVAEANLERALGCIMVFIDHGTKVYEAWQRDCTTEGLRGPVKDLRNYAGEVRNTVGDHELPGHLGYGLIRLEMKNVDLLLDGLALRVQKMREARDPKFTSAITRLKEAMLIGDTQSDIRTVEMAADKIIEMRSDIEIAVERMHADIATSDSKAIADNLKYIRVIPKTLHEMCGLMSVTLNKVRQETRDLAERHRQVASLLGPGPGKEGA